MKRTLLILTVIVAVGACVVLGDWMIAIPKDQKATYVGRNTCAACHAEQYQDWLGSHHDKAMDLATDETVLGDFNDAELTYQGVTSKMFRRDGKFMINTEGPDGKLADFEVKYVIGVEPLQQYMVEMSHGRIQVLQVTWDTRRKEWYFNYPPDVKNERIRHDDPLHWTGRGSNWNHMCAECHTTDLDKGFDVATNTYHTTWKEIDVSCETCHGPGSIHVELAQSNSPLWDRNHGYGLPKFKGASAKTEIESCAKCHSHRRGIHAHYRTGNELTDHYLPALLRDGLYHADGQVNSEVYVYGSFAQSKMFAKGVRCTDCHDAHSTKIKMQGNNLCTSCHTSQHPAAKFDTTTHHHHPADSTGASCVECHMPEKHYMVVDGRRDHSLRPPRPDLSVVLGTPNACTACHLEMEIKKEGQPHPDRPHYADWLEAANRGEPDAHERVDRLNRWAADATKKWYGEKKDRKPHYALAFTAARQGKPEAFPALLDVLKQGNLTPIVHATALHELSQMRQAGMLGQFPPPQFNDAIDAALKHESPLVRRAALSSWIGVSNPDDGGLIHRASPLLDDPSRAVRIEAVRVLAPFLKKLKEETKTSFDRGVAELEASYAVDADQIETHLELAVLYRYLDKTDQSEKEFRDALNVARDGQQRGHVLYRHAMMMISLKEHEAAERDLKGGLKDDPTSSMILQALTMLYLESNRIDEALEVCGLWREAHPDDPYQKHFWDQLQQRKTK